MAFTRALTTSIGRVRLRCGLTAPDGPDHVPDERIQEAIDASTSEDNAALMLLRGLCAMYAGQIVADVTPDTPEWVRSRNAQARYDAFMGLLKTISDTTPVDLGLPVRSFSSLGRHPSDPVRYSGWRR